MNEEQPIPKPAPKPSSGEWQYASWVSPLGKWAWIIGIISGIINIIWGVFGLIPALVFFAILGIAVIWPSLWLIISGIIILLLSFAIIKPKVSNKCAENDWNHFHEWVWNLGGFRFPFVLFWGIIIELIGSWWGGIPVIIVAFMVIFLGPKPYKWSE
jgi:hypothetical protein